MRSRPWVIMAIFLCAIFAAIAFPILVIIKDRQTAIVYTLIGFGVIWLANLAGARALSRPGLRNPERKGRPGG